MNYKITLLALSFTSFSFSQNLASKPVTRSMSLGSQPGIEISIPNVSEDNVEDAIDIITKAFNGKTKKVKGTNEFYLDEAIITQLSSNTIDIHQIIEKNEKQGFNYVAFFSLGGKFLDSSSGADKFAYASEIITKIGLKASELHTEELLKDENKILKKLEDAKKDLYEDNEKAARDIQKAKDLIIAKEKSIESSLKTIENKKFEIEQQRQKVTTLQTLKASFIK